MGCKRFLLVPLLLLSFLAPGVAGAQSEEESQLELSTAQAMESYDMLAFESARKLLDGAINRAEAANVSGPVLARSYMYLAVVYFSGLDQASRAAQALESAVSNDSSIAIDLSYRTEELAELLATVKGEEDGDRESGLSSECDFPGMRHDVVEFVEEGDETDISVRIRSSSTIRVTAYYRSAGERDYDSVVLEKVDGCRFEGTVPESMARSDGFHYYVKATNRMGMEMGNSGTAASPHIVEIGENHSHTGGDDDLSGLGGEFHYEGGRGKSFFAMFAMGFGGGYISGRTETRNNEIACCVAWAPFQIMPEFGFYLSPQTTLSGAVRLGFPVGANVSGHKGVAPALLGRLRHALDVNGRGFELSGALGIGIIRNVVEIESAPSGADTDTAAAGPILIGGGVAYSFGLIKTLALVAEVNGFLGINGGVGSVVGFSPSFGAQLDFNLAARMSF